MATLKDVAAECNLTVTTVSRVLNNRGYISKETRAKVEAAMKKLNYRPNEVARSLSKKSTNTIGVIVPHIRHPYFAEMISNVENAASKKGYKIILCNSRGKDEMERKYLEMCSSNRVAGVILFSGGVAVEDFVGSNIPIVTVERFLESGTAGIECDNKEGGELATRYLIENGCKTLLHISGVTGNAMPADDRAKSFVSVCEECGVKYYTASSEVEVYENQDYHDFLTKVLTEHQDVDGIFASSDLIAAQLIQVLTKMGKSIPKDVKIVGFDDVSIASLTTPGITTIHQPIKEMATAAVDVLVAASEGKTVAKRTLLPVSLVKRETA
ncbi:MAG: LacI family DNA-binding transcriptional regulator [Lachnospiraceae bacterium]|nr:LacI family DNA-binding transcriptional regulator [Lachnospiraceae bacterium]